MRGRSSSEWKRLLCCAVFCLALAFVAIVATLVLLPIILIAGAFALSFVSGHLYRADLVSREATSKLFFLRVAGDNAADI